LEPILRLFPRLLLTQMLPLLIVLMAAAAVLASTMRVTSALGELRDGELNALRSEAALHRAGWAVDVAMRHAAHACRADDEAGSEAELVRARAGELRDVLGRTARADAVLRRVSRSYVELASRIDPTRPCIASVELDRRRAELDEQLTNAWVGRMARLHDAVIERDDDARSVAGAALGGGVVLVVAALAIALVVSLAFARSVSQPLERLTLTARRLGQGAFDAPIESAGGPTELVEFGRELESMRRRLAELDSLKQQFVASVSHEMRTPLSKMREALALLADGAAGELGPRQQRVVKIARVACERQIRTVTSMLDLSRLRAGSPLRMREKASLDGAIRAAIDEEQADAATAGVSVELTLEGEHNVLARIDDVLVERAVANLVRNAVAVSSRGQAVVVTRTLFDHGPGDAAGRWARLAVKDDGPGVPPELEQSIFEPFVSHDVAGSPKTLGVGLGLALASEVARAHGGCLEIVRPERGAQFELWIPLSGPRESVPPEQLA
jgi:two-component system sensor histidine kinase GlrK